MSEQLHFLEVRLGVPLVERSRSKVRFTADGVEVAEIARQILKNVHSIRDLCAERRRNLAHTISIGVLQSVGPAILSRILPELRSTHANLTIRVSEDIPQALLRGLEDGFYDVVLVEKYNACGRLSGTAVFDEPIYLTLPASHALAQKGSLLPSDLRGIDMLALAPRFPLHNFMVQFADRLNANLNQDVEIGSLDTLREMIKANLRAAFLPGLYVISSIIGESGLRTVVIEGHDYDYKRRIYMMWRKSNPRRKLFQKLATSIGAAVNRQFRSRLENQNAPTFLVKSEIEPFDTQESAPELRPRKLSGAARRTKHA